MNANVKRKFNALIQGIGNRPSTPVSASTSTNADASPDSRDAADLEPSSSPAATAHMANDFEFLAKRRRLGVPSSTPGKGATLQADQTKGPKGLTTISNITLRKWTPTGAANAKDAAGPKYSPGDREQLLKRLATYQELTDWTPKPDRVNEVEWAKRGWICQGKERVKCAVCSKELVVKLNRRELNGKEVPVLIAADIEESLVDKYVELMVTTHQEDCPWRKKGCDGTPTRWGNRW